MNKENIKRIALTGGPCGGKTTGLANLQQNLQDAGYTTIIVPEAATIAICAGFKPGRNIAPLDFQRLVANTILSLEDRFIESAAKIDSEKIVLICDRGMMDGRAYMSDGDFSALLQEYQAGEVLWRDSRYDAVFHLRTAALGAESFYTLVNNSARSETPEQAIALDEKILKAWTGHPHLRVIDNRTDFGDKLLRLRQEVFQVLGIPVPLEIERKFLVEPIDVRNLPIHHVAVDIEQVYIISLNPDEEVRVRRRGQNGSFTYYRTTKQTFNSGVRSEEEQQIDKREYEYSMKFSLPGKRTIRKRRTCFLWKDQYFELDEFLNPPAIWILEVELTDAQQEVAMPPFLKVIREVTDDPLYKNANLANS